VYNDAGEELALKVFEADEDYDTMELGTLREVSILRILRGDNGHPNVVSDPSLLIAVLSLDI
jgi:hypothetical protein